MSEAQHSKIKYAISLWWSSTSPKRAVLLNAIVCVVPMEEILIEGLKPKRVQ